MFFKRKHIGWILISAKNTLQIIRSLVGVVLDILCTTPGVTDIQRVIWGQACTSTLSSAGRSLEVPVPADMKTMLANMTRFLVLLLFHLAC